MKQALHIKNLTKKYKDFTLDHISLDLPYGMILGLIGENGSGKSTLINSILNIVKADYDEVHILGQDLKSQEKEIKKEIAVIFNDSHYGENLTPLFIGKMAATTKSLCRKGCLHGGSEFFSPLSFLQSLILHSFCSEGNLVLSFISLSPCFSEEYTEPFPL